MPKQKPQEHLPLTGEENPDQLNLEGRIFKRATGGLVIERATALAEAIDEAAAAAEYVEEQTEKLERLLSKGEEQFVDASTVAGNQYRFYPRTVHKIVHKKIAGNAPEGK